jgi:choline-sulfatase
VNGLYACQRAVRDDRWYFIRTYHEGFYEFPKVVLYDMHNDPFQEKNVADKYPGIVHLMDHRLNEWIQDNIDRHDYMIDPMSEVLKSGGPFRYIKLDRWVNRLREEGRLPLL